ncbi:MAG: FGGY family carbohydrate kinase [Planctomycetota bacterium]|nr:FGGY family carbohydrate kinase [Planctomycetota bacterium]
MIHFLGIDFSPDEVHAVVVGRYLEFEGERSARILNARRDDDGVVSVSATEWARAASYAIQELYLDLPVAARKIWGIGFAAPSGWAALGREFEPLSDVRLVRPEGIADDVRQWLAADPRREKHIAAILSPKDYFRFVLSGALATDVTLASRQGLLEERSAYWDARRLDAAGLRREWMPPVFDCDVCTGQVGKAGAESTGLPSGLWLVAGGLRESCSHVASGDLRTRTLWAPAGGGRVVYALDAPPGRIPEGFRAARSAYRGGWVLERPVSRDDELDDSTRSLETAGLPVERIIRQTAPPAVGAATLGIIGSGLVRDWEFFYRRAALPAAE